MKALLENIIRRRNPDFRFDPHLSTSIILELAFEKAVDLLRGMRTLLWGRGSNWLMLGPGVRFFAQSKITWGRMVRIGAGTRLSGLGTKGLQIGDHVAIGEGSRLIVSTTFDQLGSHIRIGNRVGIGEFAYLGGAGGLEIGDDCIIGQYLSCHPENHHYTDTDRLIRLQGTSRKGIKIGPNCWLGAKVTILDGVEIGEGCVIAAGAVVTRSMPAGSIIGGVPARILGTRQVQATSQAA